MSDTAPIVELKKIIKVFPGVQALSGVDFRLFKGEVHALMGQNGAGKSTLVKVLTGVYKQNSGEMFLEGKPIQPDSPLAAQRLGINTVYQEVNLCLNLSVAENIFIGKEPLKYGKIDWKTINRNAEEVLKKLTETVREQDGTVKGFNETQETLNAKMADAKAAFGAAAIEIGTSFIPFMTGAANVAKTVGDTMAQHPAITHAVVDALGLMGGAWLLINGYNIASTILAPIATGLATIAEGEGVAAAAAGTLGTALATIGPLAAAGAASTVRRSRHMTSRRRGGRCSSSRVSERGRWGWS